MSVTCECVFCLAIRGTSVKWVIKVMVGEAIFICQLYTSCTSTVHVLPDFQYEVNARREQSEQRNQVHLPKKFKYLSLTDVIITKFCWLLFIATIYIIVEIKID